MFFCTVERSWDETANDESIENPEGMLLTVLDDDSESETASFVTPPRKNTGGKDVPRTPETEDDSSSEDETPKWEPPEVVRRSVSNADWLPFPQVLSFEPSKEEEPPFGLERILRSIPPIGYALLAILLTYLAKNAFGSNPSSSSIEPEDVADVVADMMDRDAEDAGTFVSDFFKDLVIRDNSGSQIQILHPKIILAVPAMVINSIQGFFRLLIGAATHNFAGRDVPGVRGGHNVQPRYEEKPKGGKESKTSEGEKKRRFSPEGFIRRLRRPKTAVDSS